jgi:hypothetical protein
VNLPANAVYTFTVSLGGCTSPISAPVGINAAPTAPQQPTVGTITQPTCQTATGSVVLSGLPTVNWTINPGNISGNTSTVTIGNLSPGDRTFTVTVNNCTSIPSLNVHINDQPVTPPAPLVNDQSFCGSATVA